MAKVPDDPKAVRQPPEGWRFRAEPDWPKRKAAENDTRLVRVGAALIPSHFTFVVWPPDPPKAAIVLACQVVEGEISVTVISAMHMDAIRAADLLRKALPLKDWMRLAILHLSVQLLLDQARQVGDPELLSQLLRVDRGEAERLLRHGQPLFADEESIPSLQGDPAWAEAWGLLYQDLQTGSFPVPPEVAMQRKPRRNSVTKEHLKQVAATYREATAAGLAPTKAVAERLDASHSTAARWVGMARKEGFLGAATPGRAGGEQPPEK